MNNNSIFYSYIYLNPLKFGDYDYGSFHFNYEPFYVGKGTRGRHKSHLKEAKEYNIKKFSNILKIKIINNIWECNKEPIVLKIKENLTNDEANELEVFLINLIGRRDKNLGPLTNLTDGGDGGDTFSGKKHKQETKEKMSRSNKGISRGKGELNPNYKKGFYKRWIEKYGLETAEKKLKEFKIKQSELIYIKKGLECKKIKKSEFFIFEKEGWIKGRVYNNRGKIYGFV